MPRRQRRGVDDERPGVVLEEPAGEVAAGPGGGAGDADRDPGALAVRRARMRSSDMLVVGHERGEHGAVVGRGDRVPRRSAVGLDGRGRRGCP